MAPLPQKLDDSGGAPNLSRRKSNENVGFVAPHPVVQLLLRRSLNSLCIFGFLPKGWGSIFNQMNTWREACEVSVSSPSISRLTTSSIII